MIDLAAALQEAERIAGHPRREAMRAATDAIVAMAAGLIRLDGLARTMVAFLSALDAAHDADQRRDIAAAREARAAARTLSDCIITELVQLGYVAVETPEETSTHDDSSTDTNSDTGANANAVV